MRNAGIIAALAIVLSLTACGPVYRTSYHFTPPDSQRGRECVNACQATLQQCEANATFAHQQCLNRAERSVQACESRKKYEPDPKKGWKNPICVENCLACSRPYCDDPDTGICDQRYRECYATCGGTIEKTVECTSNCDAR